MELLSDYLMAGMTAVRSADLMARCADMSMVGLMVLTMADSKADEMDESSGHSQAGKSADTTAET
jgi:hypothetical protein